MLLSNYFPDAVKGAEIMFKWHLSIGDLMKKRFNESTASLKELTTTMPMSSTVHAEIVRRRVVIRRLVEDAREETKLRRSDLA